MSEADLWEIQRPIAEAALDFGIAFLGCMMDPNNSAQLDSNARSRLLALVRAVSIVESRHGTVGANQPARDPFQSGNPNDTWWRELTGQLGQGDRFVRGAPLPNLWANEVADIAEVTPGLPNEARRNALADLNTGHDDAGFCPAHSYYWGIIYLLHKVNTNAGDKSYGCGDLSRDRLLDGAVQYNGGGVPNYRSRLESALAEFGDPLAQSDSSFSLGLNALSTLISESSRTHDGAISRIHVKFDRKSGRPISAKIDFVTRGGVGDGSRRRKRQK